MKYKNPPTLPNSPASELTKREYFAGQFATTVNSASRTVELADALIEALNVPAALTKEEEAEEAARRG